jgi:AcrR family transcriptional regulator
LKQVLDMTEQTRAGLPTASPPAASTRERLLEVAGEVFADHGYQGATIRRICRAAGVNVGAINYHFGDKEHLYREVLHYAFAQMHQRHPNPEIGPEQPLAKQARQVVSAFLTRILAADSSWHGRLFARELAEPTAAIETVVATFMQPLQNRLEALVGRARPDLSEEQRRLHALGLLGQCVFFKHARPVLDVLFGPGAYGADQIATLTDHIVAVFLRGLEVTP